MNINSYLVFSDIASAQARSQQQAAADGCAPNGETKYWWPVVTGPAGQAALVIAGSGDYGQQGLIAGDIAALQSADQLTALGWTLA
jgi:hypothetical protein